METLQILQGLCKNLYKICEILIKYVYTEGRSKVNTSAEAHYRLLYVVASKVYSLL